MTPEAIALPTVPGTPFAGGFYGCRYFIGLDAYALIVAPKAEGDLAAKQWNESKKRAVDALSYNDGLANTIAMISAGSELAQRISELRIGECEDWYIGSKLEMLCAYHELQAAPAFALGGAEAFEQAYYWTSTQYAGYEDYAWCQSFDNGSQIITHKNHELRARAVRRVRI